MHSITQYRKNIYSQFGEDGILEFIINRMQLKTGTCVEFGAWDGFHCSNTAHLWNDLGWNGVLIEGDENRFHDLLGSTSKLSNVERVCEYVTPTGTSSIGAILASINVSEVDLMSIDIDGDDYHIFESMEIKPKIIVIEHNPSLPAFVDVHGPYGVPLGASVAAMKRVAESKGYILLGWNHCNVFLVDEEYADCFDDVEKDIYKLFDFSDQVLTYACTDYAGNVFHLFPRNKLWGLDYTCETPSFGFKREQSGYTITTDANVVGYSG